MHRRDFLRTTGGAAAAVAASGPLAAPAAGAELAAPAVRPARSALTLPFTTSWPSAVAGYADEGQRLARRIEALSEGALRIEMIAPDGADAASVLRYIPLQRRVADHAAFAYVAGLPGSAALNALAVDGWLRSGGGQELWDELAAQFGVKPLLAGHTGGDLMVWSATPIASLDDISGRRIFVRGLAAEVARGLGAEPVSLSEFEAQLTISGSTAAPAGALDAVEWGGLVQSDAEGLPARMPYALAAGFTCGGAAQALEVPLPVWESLGTMGRAVITAAASAEYLAIVAEERAVRATVSQILATRRGVRMAKVSPELAAARDRVASAVIAHTAGTSRVAQRFDQSYMAFLKAAGGWSEAGPAATS